jgi:hypothetical protein
VDAARANYVLNHTVRTHMASEDAAYLCMGFGEDAEGIRGVFLRKNVIEVASAALTENLSRLGPLLTPPSVRVSFCSTLTVKASAVVVWSSSYSQQ